MLPTIWRLFLSSADGELTSDNFCVLRLVTSRANVMFLSDVSAITDDALCIYTYCVGGVMYLFIYIQSNTI